MNEPAALHDGSLYQADDAALANLQAQCLERQYDYNQTRPSQGAKRQSLLQEMFAAIGPNCYIEPPLHANWGGRHMHFGAAVYANFNLTLVDDTDIYVGDHTMFGPNVTIAAGTHPVLPALRETGYQYNVPVRIGRNCWIGAAAVILPGVTIGDNTVIGAGSVVTRDLPANVVAYGNPCHVARPINDHDREYYFKDRQIDPALLK